MICGMTKKRPTAKKRAARRKSVPRRHVQHREDREQEDPLAKVIWKPGTMLCPVPVVMVTCVDAAGCPNIVTVAWTGTVCSDPPLVSISLRQERHSYDLVAASGEFVINVPSVRQLRATDFCGVRSGRDVNKFEATKLTPGPASTVKAPLILECPVSLECSVREALELGSHTMFIAEVTAVQVTKQLITPSGRLALERAGLAAFAHGNYYALGKKMGSFGYAVRRKKKGPRK
jgi:flavin reductase (DIM6/NTAB) family NADH-FMN oxidoreductase RutF